MAAIKERLLLEEDGTDDEVLSAMGESAARGSKRILEYGQTASRRYSRFIKPYLTGDDSVELDYYDVLKYACINAMSRIDNGSAKSVKDAVDGALDDIDEYDSNWAILWHNADYTEPRLDDAFSRFASTVTSAVSDYAESKGKKDDAEDGHGSPDQKDYMRFISPYLNGGEGVTLNFDDAFEAVCKEAIGSIDDGTRAKARDAVEDAVDSVIGDDDSMNWAILYHYCDSASADYDKAIEVFVREAAKVVSDYMESEKHAPKAKADGPATPIAEEADIGAIPTEAPKDSHDVAPMDPNRVNALAGAINSQIASVYGDIDGLNGLIAMLRDEPVVPSRDEVIGLLDSIVDDRSVHVGILQAISGTLSGRGDLVDAGSGMAADEIAQSEPAEAESAEAEGE